MTATEIFEKYQFHTWLVKKIVEGITNEESLLPLPFETNSLNWVLGHIVTNRSHALEAAGVPHTWQNQVRELYHTGTANTKPESNSISLETLLTYLDESDALLKTAMENITAETLDENFTNYRGEKTRQAHLNGFHWHETYHVGQLEIFKDFVLHHRKK